MKKIINKIKNRFSIHFLTSFKKERKTKLSKKEKILKYTTLIMFPCLAIASGTILGISEYNAKNNLIDNEVVINTTGVNRKIFLVSDDNYTIPITVKMDERTTLQQEIVDVFNLLKTSSKVSTTYVNGFINDDTKLISFSLNDGVLELNLSSEFLETKYNHVNVIEGLTLTFLQFDEINSLKLLVDGEQIDKYNNVPLPTSLDYSFGINNDVSSIKDIIGKEKVVVFGNRVYDSETSYLIPVSLYVEPGETNNITFVEAINKGFSSSSNLTKLDIYQGINQVQESNESFILDVNNDSLESEGYVKKELFDLVNLSLEFMGIDELVSFNLEGESIQVSGVYELEDYQVSNTIVNEFVI